MVVILIRTLIIFVTLVVVMRLMGKRQIGEMQPFEFIVTLIIADLACIPMADVSIPLVYGIVAILGLFILHQLLSIIEQTGALGKKIISGKPSIVINKNGVDLKELKNNNMGVDDLIESMRAQGYFSLDDLDYAIFESNGKLSPLVNPEKQVNKTSIPVTVIEDGKIEKENLNKVGGRKKVDDFLQSNAVHLKKIEIMTVDGNGRTYMKCKNQKYKILNYDLSGEKW